MNLLEARLHRGDGEALRRSVVARGGRGSAGEQPREDLRHAAVRRRGGRPTAARHCGGRQSTVQSASRPQISLVYTTVQMARLSVSSW